ncbi:MAG: hypothetical protein A2007_02000 [Verrucomicrobia bacterium GWC2_42_7]|nr:MAG: hypothetical protein A2007_02000 [Verrucomicrobia bacterium GWC2_42_7]
MTERSETMTKLWPFFLIFIQSHHFASGIVGSHNSNAHDFLSLGDQFPASVCVMVFQWNGITDFSMTSLGSGTYIVDKETNARSIITARHIIEKPGNDIVIWNGYNLFILNKNQVLFPIPCPYELIRKQDLSNHPDKDIALLALSQENEAALACDPIPLDWSELRDPGLCFISGFGESFKTLEPDQKIQTNACDWKRRAGAVALKGIEWWNKSLIYESLFLEEIEIPLNSTLANGDSGGGVFKKGIDENYYLIAVNNRRRDATKPILRYGSRSYYTPIHPGKAFIQASLQNLPVASPAIDPQLQEEKIKSYRNFIEEPKTGTPTIEEMQQQIEMQQQVDQLEEAFSRLQEELEQLSKR